ncbi:3,4-dihydroxy-2-butanone-4-phosphate synthase [Orbus wheelerorum]|uniref:3,4-dihydroxy-2-butanone-4-phosphate synthase n=1 Tax=Orbus wheelerorum TaxID=3074111 RepID=UPI00370DBD78
MNQKTENSIKIVHNTFSLAEFGSPIERVKNALAALKAGKGVLVLDDEDRENEGDVIWAAENITSEQMALTIRYGSGIVCLCMPKAYCDKLALPMMVPHNTSKNKTAFTISIEAANGVSTGVSASDRVTTVRAAVADNAKPTDLNHPGHVFPLVSQDDGVFARRGHTEASVDLVKLAGFKPAAVICELTNDDGSMSRAPEVVAFAKKFGLPVVTIEDIVEYRRANS